MSSSRKLQVSRVMESAPYIPCQGLASSSDRHVICHLIRQTAIDKWGVGRRGAEAHLSLKAIELVHALGLMVAACQVHVLRIQHLERHEG